MILLNSLISSRLIPSFALLPPPSRLHSYRVPVPICSARLCGAGAGRRGAWLGFVTMFQSREPAPHTQRRPLQQHIPSSKPSLKTRIPLIHILSIQTQHNITRRIRQIPDSRSQLVSHITRPYKLNPVIPRRKIAAWIPVVISEYTLLVNHLNILCQIVFCTPWRHSQSGSPVIGCMGCAPISSP